MQKQACLPGSGLSHSLTWNMACDPQGALSQTNTNMAYPTPGFGIQYVDRKAIWTGS